jgi:hypothetical protein
MNAIVSANTSASALRSRGVGTIVCAGFAALWANASRPEWPSALVTVGFAAIALITVALIVAGIKLIGHGGHAARTTDARPSERRRTGLYFTAIFAAEIIALNIAAYLLTEHQLDRYLMPAVAIIVGLHFFPLARLFRAPRYQLTGAFMTLAGVSGAVAIACGLATAPVVAIVDIACAVTLWMTGFASYVSTMRAFR